MLTEIEPGAISPLSTLPLKQGLKPPAITNKRAYMDPSLNTSIKTRIETRLPYLDIHQDKGPLSTLPLKQGLKPGSRIRTKILVQKPSLNTSIKTRIETCGLRTGNDLTGDPLSTLPLKQGLKPPGDFLHIRPGDPSLNTSIKTRIETKFRLFPKRLLQGGLSQHFH